MMPREIRGESKTVRQLLSGVKYSIEFYQREYLWQEKQIQELIQDLTGRFSEDHDDSNERSAVANYGHYFLGSIVISAKNGVKYIIDGQQRLTSLTLLLIFLNNAQKDRPDQVSIKDLILSEKYGKKSFNLDIEERAHCMEVLFNQEPINRLTNTPSIQNILARYSDIENFFPADIKDETLPYFIDWLIDNVHLVEITAYSDDDAYTIFETMNDRGLSLSPADMLKGFLLANITDEEKRNQAAAIWKQNMVDLRELGPEEGSDFIKTWLRSQYAMSIRRREKGARPEDYDKLGTEFHRWVRDHTRQIELNRSEDYFRFFDRDLNFYAAQYRLMRTAAKKYTPGLENIYHLAQLGFTLQYPVMLAPLQTADNAETIQKKLRMVSIFLEIILARRLWNWHSISYSTLQYTMFNHLRDIRGKPLNELAEILTAKLAAQEEGFNNPNFSMHKMNRFMIHCLLARMTDALERACKLPSHYLEYMNVTSDPKNRYEVEHIWASHPERHEDEFKNPSEFYEHRNRIGGLLLLPRKFNASYNDLPYENKLDHYLKANLLAQSLHPLAYKNNPGFIELINRTGLPFVPYEHFHRADLEARQALYCRLAEFTWSPGHILEVLD